MPQASCSESADPHELPLCVGEPPRVPTPLQGRLLGEGRSYPPANCTPNSAQLGGADGSASTSPGTSPLPLAPSPNNPRNNNNNNNKLC